ncbi:MAG: winged helix-turn-helix transcriptional regulator [Nonomuraea sp.]|nr:winged helix-turn-helix transcriptional regulator [Nonomuraea sp.]
MSQVGERVGYLIKQVDQAFRRASEERLREIGLSLAQYAVLRALADAPGAAAAELARRTFVTRQSLRDVLNGLRRAGLVEVAEQADSGRALPVTLTGRGRELMEQGDAMVLEVEERMIAGVAAEPLRGLLRECARNLGR